MKTLHGIVAALVTPFDAHDRLDPAAVRSLVEFLIEAGVHGLYPTGTTGEMDLLSVEERKQIAETVVQQSAGRATVYIQIGTMTLRDSVELAKHAHASGADGIGVVTPSFFGVTDREMEEYFVEIAQSVPDDFPVYLYNIPQLSGNDLKPATVEVILSRCPNVVGIKYSGFDFLRVNEYLNINGGRFSVLIGADRLTLAGAALGCDGIVSGTCCVVPELYVEMWKAVQDGKGAAARELQKAQQAYSTLVKHGGNMAFIKAGLQIRGVWQSGFMRRPLRKLAADEVEEFARALAKWRHAERSHAASKLTCVLT
jgi:dihydrodipicolinate synthase/N-acetylneuraminate lyase